MRAKCIRDVALRISHTAVVQSLRCLLADSQSDFHLVTGPPFSAHEIAAVYRFRWSLWSAFATILRFMGLALVLYFGAGLPTQAAAPADQIRPLATTSAPPVLAPARSLVVGSEQDYPPFATGMTDAAAGGFTVDLWKMVAQAAGIHYTLRVLPFHELLREFKEGKIDVLINLAMTDDRRAFADFSVPHVTVHGAIFVRDDQSGIQSEVDLAGKSVIVVNADAAQGYAVAKGWGPKLVAVDTAAEGLRLLASGRHDAMLLSQLTGLQILQQLALNSVKALPVKIGFAQKFAFATQHGQADLLAKINEELAITKANRSYDALYEQWFGGNQVRKVGLRDVLKYLIPVVALLLGWGAYLAYRRQLERNLAAAAITESRDLLLAIIDTVPVRVFWKDRELRYLGCNAAFARDAGMTHPGEVIGKDDFQMGWAAQAELYRADDRRVMESGTARLSYEEQQTTPNGATIWLRTSKVPLKNAKQETVGLLGIYEDFTERRKSAEALRTLSLAVAQSSASVVVTDTNGTIEYVNPQFTKASGYSAAEAIGSNPRLLQSKQTSEATYLQMWKTLGCGDTWHGDFINKRKNGELYWEESHISPIKNDAGSTTHYVAIKTDITDRKLAESRLIESEAKIKGVLESAADAIFITDQSGSFQYANERASHLLGYSRDEFVHMTIGNIATDKDQVAVLQLFGQLISNGTLRHELRLRRKNGQVVPVDLNGAVLPDGSVFGSCRDISERKRTEKLLQESESHLNAIIETEPECIKIVDAQGLLVQMNPAGLAMIEADSLAQVKGLPIVQVIAPEHRNAFEALHQRVMAGESVKMEFQVIGLKGARRWLETSAAPMQEHGQTVHLAVTRDITQRKLMEEQVRQLAFHDPLTGLPNRRLLLDRLSQAMVASKRSGCYCALMFLDLDKFKALNDTHGHNAGDLLLLEVTRRLTSCVREVDTVSRFGGDEFVVLLGDLVSERQASTVQVAIVAEKIRVALQDVYVLTISHEGCADTVVEHHCTASIGVVVFINHEASQNDIMKWADAAMYQAKDAGRNTVRFHDSNESTAIAKNQSL